MKHALLLIASMALLLPLNGQDYTRQLDTLKRYDVNLDEVLTTWGKKYMANGKEISKEQYQKYRENWSISEQCHPCIMVTYDHLERIKHQAIQHYDCFVGEYIEFFPDGKVKTKGTFKSPPTDDWSNLKMRQLCSMRDGKWTYYNESGKVDLIETYENGRMVRAETPSNNEGKPMMGKIKGVFKPKEKENTEDGQ